MRSSHTYSFRKLPSLVFVVVASFSEACTVFGSELLPSTDFSFGLASESTIFLVVFKTVGVREGRWMGTGLCVTVGEGGLCFNKLGDGGRFFCVWGLLVFLKF